MKYRLLGATGLRVSELGFGCSSLGASVFEANNMQAARLLETAFDNGVNFYDTAAGYAYGRSEALLGQVFGGRRDRVIIATKAGFLPSSLARFGRFIVPVLGQARKLIAPYKRKLKGISKRRQNFSPAHLTKSAEQSLRRLRSDYIDLFLLHNPSIEVLEQPEVVQALEALRRQGKIRHYGVSAGTIDDAVMCLGRPGISALQVELNLLHKEAATKLLAAPDTRGVGLLARIPFARGVLTSYGQVRTGAHKIDSQGLDRATLRVREVAQALGGRPYLPEAALRFVLGHGQVASVIAGTTSERHLLENIKALVQPQLSEGDMKLITDAFADVSLRV